VNVSTEMQLLNRYNSGSSFIFVKTTPKCLILFINWTKMNIGSSLLYISGLPEL